MTAANNSAIVEFQTAVAGCRVDTNIGFVDLSGILNHEMDPSLLLKVSQETVAVLAASGGSAAVAPELVFTAPASGNALASLYGAASGCKVLLCKTGVPKSWLGKIDLVQADVPSRTMAGVLRTLVVKREALAKKKVVIVDDVLGFGNTAIGLLKMCQDAGAEVVHYVAFVEKVGEGGRQLLKEQFPNLHVHAIASVNVFAPKDVDTSSDDAGSEPEA